MINLLEAHRCFWYGNCDGDCSNCEYKYFSEEEEIYNRIYYEQNLRERGLEYQEEVLEYESGE